jgi:NADPH-dependent 2,4-dienoyl-CoA reductase/sulfur reductase-like enzyme
VARGEHAWPSVEHDVLSLVGLFSRWIPPTFYHHRFLRPRRMRKRYLDLLRWFGGRGRLHIGATARIADGETARAGRPSRLIETDVLVVGGGRAGTLAALAAAETGAKVTLLEVERELGGAWRIDEGRHGTPGTVAELEPACRVAGIQLLCGTAAIGWYDGIVTALGEAATYEIHARSVVAATGSYERVPLVPGADRPGVMAARAAAWLIGHHGILPGRRVLLVGEGEELAMAGRQLGAIGADLVGAVETGSLAEVRGRRGVSGAVIREDGADRHVSVDLVVFGDRTPNLDLVLAAGASVEGRDGVLVPIQDASGATSVAGLFVAGSAAGRPIEGATAAEVARAIGRAAADHASGRAARVSERATSSTRESTATADPHPDAVVCFCEDVRVWEIRSELAAGYLDPELVKRRTGALTGPCQGKYCLQSFACLAGGPHDGPVTLPTTRPPLRPVRLGDLVAVDDAALDVADVR